MKTLSYLVLLSFFISCISEDIIDDFVGEEVRITTTTNEIEIGNTLQLSALYLNNVGQEESANVSWTSSNTNVIIVSQSGLVEAIATGSSMITAQVGTATDTFNIAVVEDANGGGNNEITGSIFTTTNYALSGNFTLTEMNGNLTLSLADNYVADSSLPGLYIYLSNNPNSIENALEIGAVNIFSGAHSYNIANAGINDYSHILYWCVPFNTKVGQGNLQQ